MSTKENVQIVKDFFAAMGRGDKQGLLALAAEDIEWMIPGEGWGNISTRRRWRGPRRGTRPGRRKPPRTPRARRIHNRKGDFDV